MIKQSVTKLQMNRLKDLYQYTEIVRINGEIELGVKWHSLHSSLDSSTV